MKTYCIGITTFSKRYDDLKRLLISIRKYNSTVKIIVIVNGETRESNDSTYVHKFSELITSFSNTFPIFMPEFRSVSKMFNTLSILSDTTGTIILNDDTEIKEGFFEAVESKIEQSTFFKMNGSFSHFYIDKAELNAIGYFDERLLGIGEEDGDLLYRYMEMYDGKWVDDFHIPIAHYHSYARHESITPGVGKYSKQNRSFIFNVKYAPAEKGIVGMYGSPHKKLIPDTNCYPYERFYNDNKHTIYL